MEKNIILKVAVLLFSLAVYFPLPAQRIIAPTSNDTLYSGDTCVIKWKDFDRSHKRVNLALLHKDSVVEKIADSKRNWKVFKWFIPRTIKPDLKYRIKLSSAGDENYHCFSEDIMIMNPSLVITEPTAESTWRVAGGHMLKWEHKGGVSQNLTIQLFRNDVLKRTFTKRAANKGSYRVSLPDSAKVKSVREYTIRITGTKNASLSAQSQPFEITGGNLLFKTCDDIPLVWMPDEDLLKKYNTIYLSDLQHVVLRTLQFIDEREDTLLIGENVERPTKRLVTVDESVGKWCRDRLSLLLKSSGLTVSSKECTVAIRGVIKKFHVVEGASYKAEVIIKYQAVSNDGSILWEGKKSGSENNWGASYKAINYYECLSDAFLETIIELFTDASFRTAIAQ